MSSLTFCKTCGKEISVQAKSCPHCGQPNPVQKKNLPTWVSVAVIFGLIWMFARCAKEDEKRVDLPAPAAPTEQPIAKAKSVWPEPLTPEQKAEQERRAIEANKLAEQERLKLEAQAKAAATERKRSMGLLWNYSESEDQMGRGKVKFARVQSSNQFNLEFPYQGPQRATLILRNSPKHGREVMFTIEKGQLLCRFDGCAVNVRFGEGKPQRFYATGTSDHSNDTLFLNGHDRFVANAKKVKVLRIEAEFYQAGNIVTEFDVSDLKWP